MSEAEYRELIRWLVDEADHCETLSTVAVDHDESMRRNGMAKAYDDVRERIKKIRSDR
ncbi:MAG: hypothetical protein LUO93_01785 [Methanomicrobiales archaeon]|nr:hypothetical protein [Methanomicrobiales archaeon]